MVGRQRDQAVQAALRQAAVLQREQFDEVVVHQRRAVEIIRHQREQLGAKEQHIDRHLEQVQRDMQTELARLGDAGTPSGATMPSGSERSTNPAIARRGGGGTGRLDAIVA